MPFHVKHPEADALARELATLRRSGLTEAVRHALALAVTAEKKKASLADIAISFAKEIDAARAQR